jgi:membrane-associated protease RseP (regulator of RpoE activity)
MFAAGVTNNFFLVVVTFALLFGPVAGTIAVADGGLVGEVREGSAAAAVGISGGDRVLEVDGEPVANNSEFEAALRDDPDPSVSVTLANGSRVTVDRHLLVIYAADSTPFGVAEDSVVTDVNDTAVSTRAALRDALVDREIATLTLGNGSTTTGPAGALVTVAPDGPAANGGLPGGESSVVVSMADERVTSSDDLNDVLDSLAPGETVPVAAYVDGERETYEVTLGEQADGSSYMGVSIAPGVSGVAVSGFGAALYPAGEFKAMVSGDVGASAYLSALFGGNPGPITGFLQAIAGALFLPFIGLVDPTLPYNFPGFAGVNTGFYEVTGVLGVLPSWVTFFGANLLLWTGWVNLNLGIFNCIPAFPLDGGHLLRSGAEAITSRLPFGDRHALTRAITTSIGLLMLASLALMLFGPQLLN